MYEVFEAGDGNDPSHKGKTEGEVQQLRGSGENLDKRKDREHLKNEHHENRYRWFVLSSESNH
jgi:hypothetical protein